MFINAQRGFSDARAPENHQCRPEKHGPNAGYTLTEHYYVGWVERVASGWGNVPDTESSASAEWQVFT